MKRFLAAGWVFLVLLAPLYAQSPDALRISALQYALQRTPEGEWLLELIGKVSIEYQGRRLQGEQFLLDTEAARVRSDAPFSLITSEGVLNGQRVDYFYERGRGRFEGVQANLLGVYLDAALLEGSLDDFSAREVVVSTCDPLRPPIQIRASGVRLRYGARLTLRNARLFIYGQPLFALPQLTVRVRETAEIVSLPSPVYSAETGWGARVRLELPFTENTLVQASAVGYLRAVPEIRVVAGVALSGGDPILGEPDLRLRFEQSALYNLRESPERTPPTRGVTLRGEYASDIRPLLAPRERLRLSRREGGVFTSLQYQGGFGEASLRYGEVSERVDAQRTPWRTRFSLEGDWLQPLWSKGDAVLRLHLWASYTHYVGVGDYQWIRPQLELLWQPHETLSLMIGYARASTRGDSPFLTEQLRARRELSLRSDYQHGNLRFGALFKYDVEKHDLYDVQLLIGWRDRCLEPYLFWRRTPSAALLGVNLTTLNF
ncbi:MAG: hypothetical protein N2651_01015 [Fimbriimonadales bacterium]|nr:hypothetical protein [Fimbriimonadales bacterium]